ncbi:lactadherin-like isoform X1 [Oculina patagonica]
MMSVNSSLTKSKSLSSRVTKRTANKLSPVFLVIFIVVWTSFVPGADPNQCREEYNIQGMALEGFVFKNFSTRGPHVCADRCDREITCQSFNYAMETKTCELNNRTKEAKPQNFKQDPARFYIRRLNRVPLGSILELPAQSCQEIKASEGKGAISTIYWLDPTGTGFPFLVYCNMTIGEAILINCNNAVGMTSPHIIPDNQMNASSYFGDNFRPAYGRLNGVRGDGWCAKEPNRTDDWLQVDLGKIMQVCAAATQGDRNSNEWVTHFKLSLSSDGNTWKTYLYKNGSEVEFHREGNSNTVDHHKFPTPVSARYIRFHPTKRHNWNCLRVELYTIENNCHNNPVGVASPVIVPDNQMNASSYFGDNFQPAYGRLNGVRGDGWCAKEPNRTDDWLQVDLGKTMQVCAAATQGDRNSNEWVTHFKLSFSSDGNTWNTYQYGNGSDVEFNREVDSNTVDHHMFPTPVSARYIRFHPTKQYNWNCLRVELYTTNRNGKLTVT